MSDRRVEDILRLIDAALADGDEEEARRIEASAIEDTPKPNTEPDDGKRD